MNSITQLLSKMWASLFAFDTAEQSQRHPVWRAATPDVIYVYGFIEKQTGVCAMDVINALARIKGNVTLRINSEGGDVFEAVPMIAAIERHQAKGFKVHVAIDGLAASAAGCLAQVGDTVSINSTGRMMLHRPMSFAFGNEGDLRKRAEELASVEDNTMIPLYQKRTNYSAEELRAIMAKTTWYTAQQAVDAGFADVVENAPDHSMPMQPARAAMLAALYPNFPTTASGIEGSNTPRARGIPTLRLDTKPSTFKPS